LDCNKKNFQSIELVGGKILLRGSLIEDRNTEEENRLGISSCRRRTGKEKRRPNFDPLLLVFVVEEEGGGGDGIPRHLIR
jgi:hypothetical protein